MSTANDPKSAAIEAETPAAGPAPAAVKAGLTPQALAQRLFRFDMVLAGLVLLLAFFLGSFTAFNSDLFLHLGLGSPFRTGADASGWPHHAWLPSVLLGFLYEPFSPSSEETARYAVAAKALVAVAVAVVLLLIRRRGQSGLVPILCTALAIVVMSQRILLQPFVMSLLFLALTLLVLTLPPVQFPRAVWWLPGLFVLWVNMDQWYLAGPLTVALYWLGEWLQRTMRLPSAADVPVHPQRLKHLGIVAVVGLFACLLNPWPLRTFALPMEAAQLLAPIQFLPDGLVGAGRMVAQAQKADPTLTQQLPMYSPFSSDYLSNQSLGNNIAGLAYFALLVVGLASFAAPAFFLKAPDDPTAKAGGRAGFTLPLFVVFFCFAMLSALVYRAIPLFAAVAGPIAALNFQDFLRRRFPAGDVATTSAANWAVGSRAVALAACLLLVVAAWAGWLHGNAEVWRGSRHVAFGVAEDPGIPKAAAVIARIQHDGKLFKFGFNYALDGGFLFAWNAQRVEPTLKLFVDGRYGLYPERGEAFGKIRKALRDEAEIRFGLIQGNAMLLGNKIGQARADYQSLMKQHGLDYIIFTRLDNDSAAQRVANWLLYDPEQWVPVYHDGRTAVFGWRGNGDAVLQYRLNLDALVPPATFPPNAPTVTLDAGQPPVVPTEAYGSWQQFLWGPPKTSPAVVESRQYRDLFGIAAQEMKLKVAVAAWVALGTPGAAGAGILPEPYRLTKDLGPPAAPLLGVRTARNAVLESPLDSTAYAQQANAYGLLTDQEEYWVAQPQPAQGLYKMASLRFRFRQAQIITALHNAVLLQPANWQVQLELGGRLRQMDYIDFAVEHLSAARDNMNLANMRKPVPKEQFDAVNAGVKKIAEGLKQLQGDFKVAADRQPDPLKRFEVAIVARNPNPKDPLGRDQVLPRGLVQLGLKILLDVKDFSKMPPEELYTLVSWQLYLLISSGQAREAMERMEVVDFSKFLARGEFEELRAMAAAAIGDYPTADKYLELAETARGLPPDDVLVEGQKKPIQQMLGLLTSSMGWLPGDDGVGPAVRLGTFDLQKDELYKTLSHQIKERVNVFELRLMRGLLALEVGDTTAAVKHLRGALRILPQIVYHQDRPIAVRYLEILGEK